VYFAELSGDYSSLLREIVVSLPTSPHAHIIIHKNGKCNRFLKKSGKNLKFFTKFSFVGVKMGENG